MPKVLSPICDRIFRQKADHDRFQRFATDNRTVNFRTLYAMHYHNAGAPVPAEAKSALLSQGIINYLCSREGINEVTNSIGFYPSLLRL